MPDLNDLGKKVKAKYPGQYDDLADNEVGRRVKVKYPGAYDDFTEAPATVLPQDRQEFGRRPASFDQTLRAQQRTESPRPRIDSGRPELPGTERPSILRSPRPKADLSEFDYRTGGIFARARLNTDAATINLKPPPNAQRGVGGAVNQFVQSAIKGVSAIPEGMVELVTSGSNPEAQAMMVEEMQRAGKTPQQINAELPAMVAADKAKTREINKREIRPLTNRGTAFAERIAPIDPTDQSWLTAKIPSALGGAVPLAAASALGGPLAGAVLGASGNAQQAAREFDAAGVEPDKRDRAIMFAGATGLTEAFGLSRALGKFGLGRAFLKRLADIAEEAGQEGLQAYLNNVNAAVVGAYDPNRPLSQGVLESGVLGGIVGGGMQGVSAGVERLRGPARSTGNIPENIPAPVAKPSENISAAAPPQPVAPTPQSAFGLNLPGMGQGMGEAVRRAWRDGVQKNGRLPSAERGSLIDQIFEMAVARGNPRDMATLDKAMQLFEQGPQAAQQQFDQVFPAQSAPRRQTAAIAQLNASPTAPIPIPDAPVTAEIPGLSKLTVEDAETAEVPFLARPTERVENAVRAQENQTPVPVDLEAPTARMRQTARPSNETPESYTPGIQDAEALNLQRRTAEIPRVPTQEPGNRITEQEEEVPRSAIRNPQRLPKATDENINDLRAEQEQLGRLAYDQRGSFTGDLRDRYNQINRAIREYDNARAPREFAPPSARGPERFTPPEGEKAARRAALQPKTGPMPETLTPGRKVTQEIQIPKSDVKTAFSSREDARQGYFERFDDQELVDEIRRLEDERNKGIRGVSKLTPEQLEANNYDLKVAVKVQKETRRQQEAIGIEPAQRIPVRAAGRQAKKAAPRQIQHRTLGLVSEAESQKGVSKGELRVVAPDGKESVIQNPHTRGNKLASFVKSTGAIPAEAMPEMRGRVEKPLPSRSGAVPSRAIPDEAMPELRERRPQGQIMGAGFGSLQGLFERGKKASEPPPGQQSLFDVTAKSPWQDSVLSYYRANLLTNPAGRALDLGSTLVNQFADAAARPIAAAADVIVGKLTGKRSITGPSISGSGRAFGSIPQGLRDAGQVLKTGKQAIDSGVDDALYGNEIRTGLGKVVDVPINGVFRVLGSLDAPFRRFGFERNLADRAKVAALNEARAGRISRSQVKARAAELVGRTDIVEGAVRDGERAVLSEPNRISSWLAKQTQNSPNARLAIGIVQPFMRIPLNAVLKSADFSGIGGVKALYKIARGVSRKAKGQSFFKDLEEQRVFAMNVASGSFAPAAFLLGMELEDQGNLEGYYYTSKKDFPNGRVPTSINIGGENYDVNRLGGFVLAPLFIGATYNRLRKQDAGQANALLRSFSGLAQQAPGLGFHGAPAKAGRILTADEPGGKIAEEAGSITSGFIPASGALGATAKLLDQNRKRDTPGFTGPIVNKIPGLRSTLPEKTGATKPTSGAFTGELKRLGVRPGGPVKRLENEPENLYKERAGRIDNWRDQYGSQLIQHSMYQKLKDSQRKAAIESLYSRISEQANQKRPNIRSFNPAVVVRAVREGERNRRRTDRDKIYVVPE